MTYCKWRATPPLICFPSFPKHQVYNQRPPDRGASSSYLQREPQQAQPQSHPNLQSQRFQHTYAPSRFQPTYPYLPQSIIDLPPTICLSDGEEPPPYQGPCTLQLRDPEQQMELNRESVRAPPNRTVFDSHHLNPSSSCQQSRYHRPADWCVLCVAVLVLKGFQNSPCAYPCLVCRLRLPASTQASVCWKPRMPCPGSRNAAPGSKEHRQPITRPSGTSTGRLRFHPGATIELCRPYRRPPPPSYRVSFGLRLRSKAVRTTGM